MSLTSAPKEVQNLVDILEIATLLQAIQTPKAIEERLKAVYALSDAEEKKLAAAKTMISDHPKLLADIADKNKKLDAKEAELNVKEATLSKKDAILAEFKKGLDCKAAEVEQAEKFASEKLAEAKKLEAATTAQSNKLSVKENDLNAREARILAQESSLKDKAKQLKELAGGL